MKIIISTLWIIIIGVLIWTYYPGFYDKSINEKLPTFTEILLEEKKLQKEEIIVPLETNIWIKTVESTIQYPILLRTWQFYSTDIESSWDIKIYDYWDKKILRIENLKTKNWPDLKLYLWKKSNLQNEKDLHFWKIKISSLKANIGNQNYVLPDWINIDDFESVAIHCDTYNHSFWFANIK